MFIHLHKGVRVGESVRACTTVHACMCICQSPLSISNEQPVNEGGPCSFHSNSQEIITLCLKPFSICTTLTASFSSHLYKNPILSLPLFRSFPLFSLPRAILPHLHTSTYLETDKTASLSTPVPRLL